MSSELAVLMGIAPFVPPAGLLQARNHQIVVDEEEDEDPKKEQRRESHAMRMRQYRAERRSPSGKKSLAIRAEAMRLIAEFGKCDIAGILAVMPGASRSTAKQVLLALEASGEVAVSYATKKNPNKLNGGGVRFAVYRRGPNHA